MRTRTRRWWLLLPLDVGLLLVVNLLTFFSPAPIEPFFLGIMVQGLLVFVMFEEYRLARLSDRLNSLEKKPEGKMRLW